MKHSQGNGSWEPINEWYDDLVGDEGHYYHRQVILPGIRRLLNLEQYESPALLDIGCGQGVLARALPTSLPYTGVDLSESLIEAAKKKNRRKKTSFITADAMQPLPFEEGAFTHVVLMLCLQNMADPKAVFQNARKMVAPGGRVIVILNHPCFRVPRSSGWHGMKEQQVQYRHVGRYMSALEVPIKANPSRGEGSVVTPSFHHPLSTLFSALASADLTVGALEEWCSDRVSEGGAAPMENRARREIPLFMTLVAEPRGFPASGPLGEEKGIGRGTPVAQYDPEPLPQPAPCRQDREPAHRGNRRGVNRHKTERRYPRPADSRQRQKPGFRSREPEEGRASGRDEKPASWRSREKGAPRRSDGKVRENGGRNRSQERTAIPRWKKERSSRD